MNTWNLERGAWDSENVVPCLQRLNVNTEMSNVDPDCTRKAHGTAAAAAAAATLKQHFEHHIIITSNTTPKTRKHYGSMTLLQQAAIIRVRLQKQN